MKRFDLINTLISRYGYKSYLEIGVRDGINFAQVRASIKRGVDPEWPATYQKTSDEFFSEDVSKYDLIFIDGLHLAEQVERDISNALTHLSDGGTIVVHDCNPQTEDAQSNDYDGAKIWNGTVWKAWAKLRTTTCGLLMRVVDTDEGCGVIQRGFAKHLNLPSSEPPRTRFVDMDYSYLERNRKELLNLVSVDTFLRSL